MKKFLVLLVMTIIFSGCSRYDESIEFSLHKVLNRELSLSAIAPVFNSNYYYYYVEPSIGRISSDRFSNVFSYHGVKFVMNLKVADVINSAYYPNITPSEIQSEIKMVANVQDEYDDFEGNKQSYHVSIYELDKAYFIKMDTPYMEFYTESTKYEAVEVAEKMLKIARSIKIDRQLIIGDFSNRQTISNTHKKIQLFQNIVPENGMINELFEKPEISVDNFPNISDTIDTNGGNYITDNYPDNSNTVPQTPPNWNIIPEKKESE